MQGGEAATYGSSRLHVGQQKLFGVRQHDGAVTWRNNMSRPQSGDVSPLSTPLPSMQ
jgi:hypothetical protein